MTDPTPRRARLTTSAAPPGAPHTLITFTTAFQGGTLTIAYVPDRDLLQRDSWRGYLEALAPATLEETTAMIADDLANELVPRWYRVTSQAIVDGITQTVTVEDKQPRLQGWQPPSGSTSS
jgi:NADPH-dependent 7-cyano-7-deazaguanine reductase QueF